MAETQTQVDQGFWTNDDGWQIAWPAAIAFAMLFHAVAFVAGVNAPTKVKQEPIEMAIAMPPPPPPPPEPPPPPPEPEKPKPKPKEEPPPPKDLPPPPNETPPDTAPQDTQAVTGVTADSVVASNAGGPQVRVGNTTFGNPDEEKFTAPKDVQRATAQPFDLAGYKRSVFDNMDREKRYPRKARVLGLEGICIVVLVVNRDGSLVDDPKILGKGTGHAVLDEECLRMAKTAKYPPIVGDTEVPLRVTQKISFNVVQP